MAARYENIDDLCHLPIPDPSQILATLRERYLLSRPYTSLSPSILIALNPNAPFLPNSDATLREYTEEFWRMGEDGERDEVDWEGEGGGQGGRVLPSHVFKLGGRAYYHMRRTGQDQSVIMSGEQGSGKSEARRLAVKAIIDLSSAAPGKKGGKVGGQVMSAQFILSSFGSSSTPTSPSTSLYTHYLELQFTPSSRLCGSKTLAYYLSRSHVSTAASRGVRNFHVLHWLAGGVEGEEKGFLKLNIVFRYLGGAGGGYAVGLGQGKRVEEGKGRGEGERFGQLKQAFKTVGLSKRVVAQVCQLLAAILHLGNLEFVIDKGRNEDAAVVRNRDVLDTVSDFLGVPAGSLESVLGYRTKLIKKELCTVFLDPEGASANRDDLANTLYSLLFSWLNEGINQKLCKDDFASFIGLLDLPGPRNLGGGQGRGVNGLEEMIVNYANERLHGFALKRVFEEREGEMEQEGLGELVPKVQFFDNAECLRMFDNQPGGLIHITDDQARRAPKKTEQSMVEAYSKRWGNHASFKATGMDRSGFPSFMVSHWDGAVTYSSEGFLEADVAAINPDFVSLLRGTGAEAQGSSNPFVRGLFEGKAIAMEVHPRDEGTIVAVQQSVKPMRAPSTKRRGGRGGVKKLGVVGEVEGEDGEEKDDEDLPPPKGIRCVLGEFKSSLDTLFTSLSDTQSWQIICLNPNDARLPNQVETRGLKAQIRSLGLAEMAQKLKVSYAVGMTHQEGCERYRAELEERGVMGGGQMPGDVMRALGKTMGWGTADLAVGKFKVFLSHRAFLYLEDGLRSQEDEERRPAASHLDVPARGGDPFSPHQSNERSNSYGPDSPNMDYDQNLSTAALPLVANAQGFRDAHSENDDDYEDRKTLNPDERYTSRYGDSMSNVGTEVYAPSRNMFQNIDNKHAGDHQEKDMLHASAGETVEEVRETGTRKRWVALCWILTWWVPSFLLSWIGRMKRPDIRQAWREKLAINLIVWFICGAAIFVIAVMGNIICPKEYVFSGDELTSHSYTNQPNNAYVAIRGEVFDLSSFASTHLNTIPVVPAKVFMKYGGLDAANIFPVQVSALCDGVDGSVSPWVTLDSTNTTDVNRHYHDFRASTNDSRPDWYFEQMVYMRYNYRVGFMGYPKKTLRDMASAGRSVAIYNNLVYELTTYIAQGGGGLQGPDGFAVDPATPRTFMAPEVTRLFQTNAGQDITDLFNGLSSSIGADVVARQKTCLRNLFLIGKVDNRNSPACLFSTYILLALSIVMVTIIGFKFLAALHFGSARAPEDHDKFVICQVPCYTEGEDSLRKTIDSMARLKYDDKRKLILIVCDGNIVGSGNDRPTPRIVLDILGVDPNLDPEPLSFLSLGEGTKQHNMGKIYSGLYECSGHVVPYLVIVKVGKPSERQRPGNRGKRDSQMVVMHFLNKVHFDSPMNPLELEMYHQIKNVIGVNPTFYEYLLQIDADTTVEELSLNRMVSAMMHDKKIIGVCGETELANAKQSIITMMQVYEYFISHHLAKAFESLFGSITCLPGCFSMYRLRTPDSHKPLFISNQVIHAYSENRVDTLHMKNLLHLGEDRYLTTLILKYFPTYKTKFVRDAHAYTVAPDDWRVLLSQRRRWINSTIHNLAELVFLEQLCGFCCFSMRFVVFIDLLSTVVAPVTVAYIGYLLYLVIHNGASIPLLSIIMLAAIYGLQALIFIFRMRWDMVAWMIFYILAIPVFTFFLPLYSIWEMDDFSWGSTRLVMNESGRKIVIHDEGKFDPKVIPLKSWNEYENELWDNESNRSLGSWVPAKKEYEESRAQSFYGRETVYDPYGPSPSASQLDVRGIQSGHHSRTPSGLGAYAYNADGGSQVGSPRRSAYGGSQYGGGGGYFQADQGSPHAYPSSRPATMVRPTSSYLPEYAPSAPLNLGGGDITDASLEHSIRGICRDADLDTLTKKGVRRELEKMYACDLGARKEVINRLIEKVLTE